MAIMTFLEYLNAQGKTIETAGDILDPKIPSPPKGPEKAVVKGKNYSFPAALDSNPNPYVSTEVKLTKKNDQTGLATFGTPNADFSKTKSDVSKVSELH